MKIKQFKKDILYFIGLLLFWFINTEKYDSFFTISGILLSFVSILFTKYCAKKLSYKSESIASKHLITYIPWIAWQAILASITTTKYIILNRKISPTIVKITTNELSDMQTTLLANSITLTPGTISINIDSYNNLYVHSLTKEGADDTTADITMRNKIKKAIK